jgi:hypothetical protein
MTKKTDKSKAPKATGGSKKVTKKEVTKTADVRTVAMLQAELTEKGIEFKKKDTKATLISLLETTKKVEKSKETPVKTVSKKGEY